MAATAGHVFYLVGDRFFEFARVSGARTVSGFTQFIADRSFDDVDQLRIFTGQGVGDYEVSYLRYELERRGCAPGRISFEAHLPELEGRQHLHKGRADNVLVGDLHKVDNKSFSAELRLHNDNEMIVDLQDRAHLYGTVAIEASRQMLVAVLERFYLPSQPERRYYIIINSINTTFDNFLFPLPASLRLSVEHVNLADPAKLLFGIAVEIDQAGRRASRTRADLTCLDLATFSAMEERRAKRGLEAAFPGGPKPPGSA